MTWPRLSDDYSDDCWQLSDAAFRLHTEALVWNARKLLDCRIPKTDLPRFAKHPDAAPELVEAGFWSDFGDHYDILHHAGYQRTSAEALAIQQRNRSNGAKGGRKPSSRERWKPGGEAAGTQIGTQTGTQLGTRLETQRLPDAAKPESRNGGENAADKPFPNPTGNPTGSPKGLVHIAEGSTSPELSTTVETLDPVMWPTDDFGVGYRAICEEHDVTTVEGLMAVEGMREVQARKCMAAAFPGRRF